MEKAFIKRFAIQSGMLFLLFGIVVVVFDPFYHYHAPIGSLKAIVTQPEYQGIGTVRNFSYDSLIAGSSVAENYNNGWFDEKFDCKTIKAIKKSATTTDLLYYLEEASENHELNNVFYSLDLSALLSDATTDFVNDSMPLYLYNENPVDDVKYLWNKDVIFEHIPYMLAMNILEDYDEGMSYNWAQYKVFSATDTLSRYMRKAEVTPMRGASECKEQVEQNTMLLSEFVRAHPDTEFYFMLPPYSMLWWDNVYREGTLEQNMYASQKMCEVLLSYENVHIYDFQAEEEVVLNLDNYMDNVHFSQDINQWMVEQLTEPEYELTKENYEERHLQKLDMAYKIKELMEEEYGL